MSCSNCPGKRRSNLCLHPCGRYASNVETSYEPEASAPNWEIDPATLEIGPKVGQGEFGSVHKVRPCLVRNHLHSCTCVDLTLTQSALHRLSCPTSPLVLPMGTLDVAALLHYESKSGCAGGVMQARWLGSTVAVKILRQADESGLGDFRTELNVLQKVHP